MFYFLRYFWAAMEDTEAESHWLLFFKEQKAIISWKHKRNGTCSLSSSHKMLSSGKSQDGKSSALIFLWFKMFSSHQNRNKINETLLDFCFGFPLPFHFQGTRDQGQGVEFSAMGEGWTPIRWSLPPGFRVTVKGCLSLREWEQDEKWLLQVANHTCTVSD